MKGPVGVVLATYGSPPSLDDVGDYLAHILGREPTDAQVAALRGQYEAVGGVHHLPETTERQTDLVSRVLADRDETFHVVCGYKHAAPFLDDVLRDLAPDVARGVVVPLAPHYNTMSVAGYHEAARRGLEDVDDPPPFGFVRSYHRHPLLVDAWSERVEAALDAVEGDAIVLFTAHSLPVHVKEEDDPYVDQLTRTSEMVAEDAGADDWELVYQSAPKEGDWLGPDIGEALTEVAGDFDAAVVAPVGFVSDHMETYYDLDVEAADVAKDLGLGFERVPALGDDPRLIECLADVAVQHVPK